MSLTPDHSAPEPPPATALRMWAAPHGAYIHPSLHFAGDPYGMSVFAREDIPKDTAVLSTPFELVITPKLGRAALVKTGGDLDAINATLDAYDLLCAYLMLHWVIPKDQHEHHELRHMTYVEALPPRATLMSPLHFTESERALLDGTAMIQTVVARDMQWRQSASRVQAVLRNTPWKQAMSWAHYLTARTMVSSRAFRSILLQRDPSSISPVPYPILLPLIDNLNHAADHPASWIVTSGQESPNNVATVAQDTSASMADRLFITVVQKVPTPAGSQVLLNYGAKSNSDLILEYGFALPNNSADTVILRGITRPIGHDETTFEATLHELMRTESIADGEARFSGDDERIKARALRRLAGLCALDELIHEHMDGLPAHIVNAVDEDAPEGVRLYVWAMLRLYFQGQRGVLRTAMTWSENQKLAIHDRARELGIAINFATSFVA